MATLALNIEILGEFKKLTSATQGAENSLKGLQDKVGRFATNIGRIAGTLGVALGFRALINGAKETVEAASDLEQQYGALDSIFKGNAQEMKNFSLEMQTIGLSSADAARQSAYLGSMLKGAGFSVEDTTDKTKDLVRLAGDLAATYGGPTADAVGAIASLMRGERDPIERYGVSLKQVDINAKLAEEGLSGLTGAARKEAEMQAALTLLYEKTTDAQGQAARESETYAGVTGRLNASFTNLQAEIGEALLPVLSDLAGFMEDSIPKIQAFFEELLDPTTELGEAWEDLGLIFGDTVDEFNNMLAAFGAGDIQFKDVLNFVSTLTAGFGQLFFFVGQVAQIIGALVALDIKKAFDLTAAYGSNYDAFVRSQNLALNPPAKGPAVPSGFVSDRTQQVIINTYNSNITAQEIYDKIRRLNKASGTAGGNFFQ
jgi:hypothetical protein